MSFSEGSQEDKLPSNESLNITCPAWTKGDEEIVLSIQYWVGGVVVFCLSIPGMLMNIVAILTLSTRITIPTTFNSLLISLFALDSIYLFFETIETFRTQFGLESNLHIILLPKFIYPLTLISISASIFLTVVVAHERYDAIKKPIQHRQSMRSAKYVRMKFLKYAFIVCVFSIGFNVPKFFEVELQWVNEKDDLANGTILNR